MGNDVLVLASVSLLPREREGDSSSSNAVEQVFIGDVGSMEFRDLLDVFIHAALDTALGAGEPTTEQVVLHPNWR